MDPHKHTTAQRLRPPLNNQIQNSKNLTFFTLEGKLLSYKSVTKNHMRSLALKIRENLQKTGHFLTFLYIKSEK